MKECPRCQRCFEDEVELCPEDGSELLQTFEGSALLAGKYRLERRLGTGGMGAVYVGIDKQLKRRVALKGIYDKRLLGGQNKARLLREARLLSQLEHPNICRVYDFIDDEAAGTFLVLELVDGLTLTEAIYRGQLDWRTKIDIAYAIASVLAMAHAAGVIHRDLKPDNVMLTGDGKTAPGRVKVLDFGVARPLDVSQDEDSDSAALFDTLSTLPGMILGTAEYMSPEQAHNKPLTEASDMYSLGLLLQELFTGRPAYEPGLPLGQLLLKVSRGETLLPEGLPLELAELIRRLKSPEPVARPRAADTAAHLEWIGDKPGRRLRRRLRWVAMAVLGLITLTLALMAFRLNQMARRAGEQARLARARHLVAEAALARDGHLDVALLLSLEAARLTDTLEAKSQLFAGLETSPHLGRYLHGHQSQVVRVSWSADGSLVASSSLASVRLWDTTTGALRAKIETPGGAVMALAFRPDGKLLAGGGDDAAIRLWDSATGERLRIALVGHRGTVRDLVWHDGGTGLVSCSDDGTVRFWDPEIGGARRDPRETPAALSALALNGDGTSLAAAGDDGTIYLWDLATGAPRNDGIETGNGPIADLAWRGGTLLTAGRDGTVRFWDAGTGVRLGEPLEALPTGLTSLALRPGGTVLASGGRDKRIGLFDLADGSRKRLVGHDDEVTSLAWSADGERLASSSIDRTVVLWNARPASASGRVFLHEDWVTGVAAAPFPSVSEKTESGGLLASGGLDGSVRLWDVAEGGPLHPPLYDHGSRVRSIALSADRTLLVSGDTDGQLILWDVARGEPRFPVLPGHTRAVLSVALTPDGTTVLSAGEDRLIRRWDAATGEAVGRPLAGHEGAVSSLAVSPDDGTLASGGRYSVRLWDLSRGEQTAVLEGQGPVAWSADGRSLAFVQGERRIVVYDIASAAPRRQRLAGHDAPVRDLAWSADSRFLASASDDKTVLVWDAATGEASARITSHDGRVLALAWLGGGVLASGATDRRVMLHEMGGGPGEWRERACRRAGRNLTRGEWDRYVGPEVEYHKSCPELSAPAGST